jgi:hypothetical protein
MRSSRVRRVVFVGGAIVMAVGLVLVACSNNDYIPIPLNDPTADDGGGGGKSDGAKTPTGEGGNDDLDSGGADCSAAPKLRSSSNGSFFCPFLGVDAGPDASTTNCTDDQTCCNPGVGAGGTHPPSFCASTPKAQKGATDQAACNAQAAGYGTEWVASQGTTWECGDKNNCSSGQVCCMFTSADVAPPDKANVGPNLNPALPKACGAKQAFKYGGTYCASSCGDTDIQMCSNSDKNCTSPKTCHAFEIYPGGRDLGYCN